MPVAFTCPLLPLPRSNGTNHDIWGDTEIEKVANRELREETGRSHWQYTWEGSSLDSGKSRYSLHGIVGESRRAEASSSFDEEDTEEIPETVMSVVNMVLDDDDDDSEELATKMMKPQSLEDPVLDNDDVSGESATQSSKPQSLNDDTSSTASLSGLDTPESANNRCSDCEFSPDVLPTHETSAATNICFPAPLKGRSDDERGL